MPALRQRRRQTGGGRTCRQNAPLPPGPLDPGPGLAVRGAAAYASSATETTVVPGLPSWWQPGDVIYAGWELTATTGTVTTPSGWTVVAGPVAAAGVTNAHHGVLRRVMQAGDQGPVITCTSGRIALLMLAFSGAHQTTPEDVAAVTDDNTGVVTPSVRAPSVTPVSDGCLLLTFHAVRNGINGIRTAFTPDATEAEQGDTSSAVAGISNAAIEAAVLALPSVAPTGAKTATATGSDVTTINMMGSAIVIRPAGGGPALPPQLRRARASAPVMESTRATYGR